MYDTFFGPLDKSACYYFYIISALGLGLVGISVIGVLYGFLFARAPASKKSHFIALGLSVLINGLFMYFTNRLWYNMCISKP